MLNVQAPGLSFGICLNGTGILRQSDALEDIGPCARGLQVDVKHIDALVSFPSICRSSAQSTMDQIASNSDRKLVHSGTELGEESRVAPAPAQGPTSFWRQERDQLTADVGPPSSALAAGENGKTAGRTDCSRHQIRRGTEHAIHRERGKRTALTEHQIISTPVIARAL